MPHHYNYETVSEAVNDLRQRGYSVDFNIKDQTLICSSGEFNPAHFTIAEIFRYEGNSDPGDEATVYGLISDTGMKGILVTGYGSSTDEVTEMVLQQLKTQK